MIHEPFVPPEEVANFVGLRRRQVLELARAGKLPGYPMGEGKRCTWRFRLSEIAESLLTQKKPVRNTIFQGSPLSVARKRNG